MDCVEVTMIGNQDIIVALAGCNWEPSCLVRLILPVRSTFLRKTRLVSSDFVDGGNWSCFWSGSYWVTFSFFDLRTFWGCWRGPSMVDLFWINVCAPGQMIGLAKKWRSFLWFLLPTKYGWVKAITKNFFTSWSGLSFDLVHKHLSKKNQPYLGTFSNLEKSSYQHRKR